MGPKENCILRGIYGFTKHTKVMYLVELLSFTLFPLIPRAEYLCIYSRETTTSLLFWSSCLGSNYIDDKMNQSSRHIFRVEGDIQVGEVALFLDERYGSE